MQGATVEVALKTSEVQMLQLELEAGSMKFFSEWLDSNQKKSLEVERRLRFSHPMYTWHSTLCTRCRDVKSERLKSRGCRLADHSSSQVSKQQGQSCLHSHPHQL